jgi:hypothetical protein
VALIGVLVVGLAVQASSPAETRKAISAEVYSAAILRASAYPLTQFLIVRYTVPYSITSSSFPMDSDRLVTRSQEEERPLSRKERAKALRDNLCNSVADTDRDSYLSAMQDYVRKNAVRTKLNLPLKLPSPYRLIKNDQEYLRDPELQKGRSIFWVSAIGFSSDMNLALVYVQRDGYAWGGVRELLAFKRRNGKWQPTTSIFCAWNS